MKSFLTQFRIPTLLGLFILSLGLVSAVYLTLQNQTINSQAAPASSPRDIVITNIEDQSATISWLTDTPVPGFITFNALGSPTQTKLDDRDQTVPTARSTHHITLIGLTAETVYQFKINSGKSVEPDQQFKTNTTFTPNGFKPIIGSVLADNAPLQNGIVYLQIDGASRQSGVVKNLGNFVIPVANIRRSDLSASFNPTIGAEAKIVILSDDGKKSQALFTIRDSGEPLGPLKIGQDIDLRSTLGISTPKFDLNGDGKVNSGDYSIILKSFGRVGKNRQPDLNGDGLVNKKDLDLISKEFTN